MSIIPAQEEKFALLITGGQCSGAWIGREIFYTEPSLSHEPWFFTQHEKLNALHRYREAFAAQTVMVLERKNLVYSHCALDNV